MASQKTDVVLLSAAMSDLARSGLDKSDFKRLRLQLLSREQTEDFVNEARASYRIPYFDTHSNLIPYARVRFLESGKSKGFSAVEGSHRYSQPANSTPHVYLPPYLRWHKISTNIDETIVITEGEKKAAAACKQGIACLALGGVWSFKSRARQWDLIPELETITWKGRNVEICFDSDVMHKTAVRDALISLAYELSRRSVKNVSFVYFNTEDVGDKTALDDYLLEHGVDGYKKLLRTPYKANEQLHVLNEKICFVKNHLLFYDIHAKKYFRSESQLRSAYANMGRTTIDGNKNQSIIEFWINSESRREVNDVVYQPGASSPTDEDSLNLWRPSNITPQKKRPTIWLDLVDYIFRKPEYASWFLQWLAYPIQHPASKLLTSIFVYASQQGVGKTLVVDPVMEAVYGKENFYRLDNKSLASNFNAYVARRQFVVVNEIYISDYRDRRTAMGSIKDMITRETAEVNEKYTPVMVVNDYCNYYLTSNHKDALMLDTFDRRFLVIEAPSEKLPQSTYTELDSYLRGEGASHVLNYLQELSLTDFNPRAAPPITIFKQEVIEEGMDVLQEFVYRLAVDAQTIFTVNGHVSEFELRTADELLRLFHRYYPNYRVPVTITRIGTMLTNHPLIQKRKIRLSPSSPQLTLYAILGKDHWKVANNKQWIEHYQTHSPMFGGRG